LTPLSISIISNSKFQISSAKSGVWNLEFGIFKLIKNEISVLFSHISCHLSDVHTTESYSRASAFLWQKAER
jgi:hypothetical protein